MKNHFENPSNEVRPPWIVYPGIPPGDIFWRFGGESYMHTVFQAHWKSLTDQNKKEYLERWEATGEWFNDLDPEMDPDIRDFLEELYTE